MWVSEWGGWGGVSLLWYSTCKKGRGDGRRQPRAQRATHFNSRSDVFAIDPQWYCTSSEKRNAKAESGTAGRLCLIEAEDDEAAAAILISRAQL